MASRLQPSVAMLAFTMLPASLAGQQLVAGTWTGSLHLAVGGEVAVEFTVRRVAQGLQVTMNAVGYPASPVEIQNIPGAELRFRWGNFSCVLEGDVESAYEGVCKVTDGNSGSLTLTAPEPRGEGADVLTRAELIATGASNVYDAVRRLRPYWIRPRGQARIGYAAVVRVYIDLQPMGDVNLLRELEPIDVHDVRFLSASEATWRFGTNNEGGAILIRRARG